jgi:hypothetical protein
MPRAPLTLTEVVIAYFFAVTGLAFIGVNLSLVVAAKVVALSLPYVASQIEPPTSRVEQRRVAAAQAMPPMPVAKLAALQMPAVAYDVLAAQLDSAEAGDLDARPAIAARKRLAMTLHMRRATEPAAAVFNRSFGVIPVASNERGASN